jgi:uncharacterized protein with HEPN domain
MRDERQTGLLLDMRDSAAAISDYLRGISKAAFENNAEKQDAVLRRLEIIGEAAGRIAPEVQKEFPNIPFREIRGMRNIIAHDYGEVDLERVWITATEDVPVLLATLRQVLSEERMK